MNYNVIRGVASALVAAAVLCGCETNPITGRSQVLLISDSQAQSMSAKEYATTVTQSRGKGKLDTDPGRYQRVKAIADRLIAQAIKLRPDSANWRWEVHVIDDAEVNAWCMAGGKMAIYTGLIQKINPSDDEIAQVMGHEISHALLDHTREKMSRALATQFGLNVGSILAGADLNAFSSVASVAFLLPNSRQAESEADRLGIEIAARSGYDPNAAVSLWTKMSNLGGGQVPQILSTHPSDQARLTALRELVPTMTPVYQQARAGR